MLGLIFVAPFLLILVVFALSNMAPVSLAFWPTDLQLQVPLSVAVLVVSAVFFILGAIVTWLASLTQRRRARRAEKRVRTLEGEVETLRRQQVVVTGPMNSNLARPGTGLRTIEG